MYQTIHYMCPGNCLHRGMFYGTEPYYDPFREPWHFNGAFPTNNDYVQYLRWQERMHMKAFEDKKETTSAEIVPFLKVITGGRDEPPSGKLWLNQLKKGTIFLSQKVGSSSLNVYCLTHIGERARRLSSNEPDGRIECFWVDPAEWCKYNHFFEIIGHIGEETEVNDEQLNRSD